ncbi:MAG: hypothetical protein HY598_03165 [Candidatus Omnitrophica bacterium]|nr:hypothetical protein [Candidatus Omnitrophota bacterium]
MGTSWSTKTTDIGQVQAGDTMDAVLKKLGPPRDVVADEMAADGRQRVEWQYDAVTATRTSFAGTVQSVPKEPVRVEKRLEDASAGPADYVVVFIDGKAATVTFR